MDTSIVTIAGPETLLSRFSTDPKIAAIWAPPPNVAPGGPLAERKLNFVRAVTIASTLLLAGDRALTLGEHIHHWMQENNEPMVELVIIPTDGCQELLRFRANMTPKGISELLQETISRGGL